MNKCSECRYYYPYCNYSYKVEGKGCEYFALNIRSVKDNETEEKTESRRA